MTKDVKSKNITTYIVKDSLLEELKSIGPIGQVQKENLLTSNIIIFQSMWSRVFEIFSICFRSSLIHVEPLLMHDVGTMH